jgi:hypothetical protein
MPMCHKHICSSHTRVCMSATVAIADRRSLLRSNQMTGRARQCASLDQSIHQGRLRSGRPSLCMKCNVQPSSRSRTLAPQKSVVTCYCWGRHFSSRLLSALYVARTRTNSGELVRSPSIQCIYWMKHFRVLVFYDVCKNLGSEKKGHSFQFGCAIVCLRRSLNKTLCRICSFAEVRYKIYF